MDPSAVDFRAFYPYTPNEVKHRKRTTSAQLKILEGVFKRDTKPNAALRNELAVQLDMTARGVQVSLNLPLSEPQINAIKVWFQNRRAKEKNKTTKSAAVASKDLDEARESLGQSETILLPQSTFPRDLPELGADSSSQESSPTGSSPPQLHLNTDSSLSSWQGSPLATPEDFRVSGDLDACYIRRGSLPENAFYNDEVTHFDPFARRRSVDASLHRLAANPYANLARAKNNALSVSRFPGHMNAPFTLSRSSSVSLASNDFSNSLPSLSNYHARHSSADSRTYRFSPHGVPVSPSPSPMSAYHSSIRSSLPDNQLLTFSTRPVSSPLPGPLPSPDFSFGIASSVSSLTSPSSERNSPDNSHSYLFRGEDLDTDDDISYGGYSRFGSIASIATSDSNTSAYYSDVSNCVDPTNGTDLSTDVNQHQHRRDSGHFVGLMSGLNVGNMSGASQPTQPSSANTSGTGSPVPVAPIPVSAVGLREGDGTSTYPSPSSTVSPGASTSERNCPATSSSLSLSNELMHAFQKQPEVNHLSSVSPSQQLQQHSNSNSPGVESEVPFYLSENTYSPITLPSASIEFATNEFHFVAQSTPSETVGFGTGPSSVESYPVDPMGQDHFTNSSHSVSQDSSYPLFDSVDTTTTASFL
ncbi:hypothetical protein D9757_000715 [Collybiopsis confluens]|uniref:Homeobox domain-containing protein n=1 Tax=Collybiopsis confluens TaxID=2823264 RepID=A0A8H5I1E7_9AGAR|nr:hypothetical protein D9757_000715 [Collybiopsis confluens]